MRRLPSLLLVVLLSLLTSRVGWAQQPTPLAEVARREAERRKTVTAPGKVYSNADASRGLPLTTAAGPSQKAAASDSPAPGTAPPETAVEAAKTPPAAALPRADATAEEAHDEAWWRKRVTELRDQLNRNRLFADALQSRINSLWNDFTSRDDPAQRAVIDKDRTEALIELERIKGEVARQERAMADLEEEARKANVPPGWLR